MHSMVLRNLVYPFHPVTSSCVEKLGSRDVVADHRVLDSARTFGGDCSLSLTDGVNSGLTRCVHPVNSNLVEKLGSRDVVADHRVLDSARTFGRIISCLCPWPASIPAAICRKSRLSSWPGSTSLSGVQKPWPPHEWGNFATIPV
jgi:hypothetical protein